MEHRRTTLALGTVALLCLAPVAPALATGWLDHGSAWTNPDAVQPQVVNLRYATHEGFDRAVIDVSGRLPSYRISYTRTCTYDASGATVPVRGRGKLAVVFSPATAHDADGSVYDGPAIARPHFPMLRALAFTGDNEGVVSFCLAMNAHASYRVLRLHDPQRIVVDVLH